MSKELLTEILEAVQGAGLTACLYVVNSATENKPLAVGWEALGHRFPTNPQPPPPPPPPAAQLSGTARLCGVKLF